MLFLAAVTKLLSVTSCEPKLFHCVLAYTMLVYRTRESGVEAV